MDPRHPRHFFEPRQNFIDSRNPRDPRKLLTYATHATHEPTQPAQFSRLRKVYAGRKKTIFSWHRQGIILQSIGMVRRILRRWRCILQWYRSGQRRRSVRKDVFKKFANITGKHLFWSLLLLKLQASGL